MSETRASAPRILLGVTTYNRMQTVALAARSLRHAEGVGEVAVVVIDDASEEYSLDALRPLFPPGTAFIRREVNSGRADYAAHALMRYFIEKRDEGLLVCLDSDLLVAGDFLARIRAAWPKSDGVLSLFNAHTHPGVRSARGEGLLEKETVGFAGTVWSRAVIADVLVNVVPTPRFDWDICKLLEETGRAIVCLEDSAVQHIGMVGQNSRFLTSDYGLGFADAHWANLSAIQEATLFGAREEIAALRKRVGALRKEVTMLRVKDAVAGLRKKR